MLLCFVATGRIHKVLPGCHIIEAAGADLSGNTVVIKLSNSRDKVPVLPEQLWQCDSVGQEFAEVWSWPVVGGKLAGPWIGANLGYVGSPPRQEGTAARTAKRKLAIGPFEPHTSRSQLVDVRRLDARVAIAPQIAIQIVCNKEQHVPLRRLGLPVETAASRRKKQVTRRRVCSGITTLIPLKSFSSSSSCSSSTNGEYRSDDELQESRYWRP